MRSNEADRPRSAGPTPSGSTGSSAGWAARPTPDAVAELLRSLELTITRRLDGVLHGNHEGLTPGHGSEPGESRPYQPGDDVRRIDWNVTARTNETYVREQIADRDLTAWLVVDTSATMHFGTTTNTKADVAMAAAAAIGFLTARHQNRLGAVLVAGDDVRIMAPRAGTHQVRAVLASLAMPPPGAETGRSDLVGALQRVGGLARRRGFVAVVSDFSGDDWAPPLGRLGLRHDLLAVTVHDPREFDVPPVGRVQFTDPATGAMREVKVTRAVQDRFRAEAAAERDRRQLAIRRAGSEQIELRTDHDWLAAIIGHVQERRVQVVRGGVIGR